jgi:MarR family transcriptional regulator, organic hydroperoxide resistance regulator
MQSLRESATGSPAVPAMGPVLEFMRVTWALDHALQKTSKHMEATLGITAPQRLVVRILGRFPGMQAGQISAVLHLHPSTLTGILTRLQRRGLITRRVDPRDRRRAVFGLTAKGRELDVEVEGTVEAAVRSALREIPQEKIRETVDVLGQLTRALQSRA